MNVNTNVWSANSLFYSDVTKFYRGWILSWFLTFLTGAILALLKDFLHVARFPEEIKDVFNSL